MEAETALRLQAANDHLALAWENLAAINGTPQNAGADAVGPTRLAALQVSLAVRALGTVLVTIPSAFLLPPTEQLHPTSTPKGGEQP